VNYTNIEPPLLTVAHYSHAAAALGCEVAAIRAVLEVETGGSGFDRKGRLALLFEPHRFHVLTAGRFTESHPRLSSPRWDRTLYPHSIDGVWAQFLEASALDLGRHSRRPAGACSSSWASMPPPVAMARRAAWSRRLSGTASLSS
jgi:hypothetical protein